MRAEFTVEVNADPPSGFDLMASRSAALTLSGPSAFDERSIRNKLGASVWIARNSIKQTVTTIQTGSRSSLCALSVGALALGATAIGALAIGALAIGALTIRRLKLVDGKFKDLHIDRLTIAELHVRSQNISGAPDSEPRI